MTTDRPRCLIFDPFSGISGDMVLGSLIDLGLPTEWLRDLVAQLPVKASIEIGEVSRGAIRAQRVRVDAPGPEPARHLSDLLEILERAPVAAAVREKAGAAFQRLAQIEGAVHGIDPEQVHFHEVGAADAIVDIVGAMAGVVELGVERCFTRPVALGSGWVTAQHGTLPVPAPATLKLLEGLPVRDSGLEGELTTPTGAVLLSVLTGGSRAPASYVPLRSGFGAGHRDPSSHPNCLRVVLATLEPSLDMYVVQADVDDMPPEYVPPLREALDTAGATDVWVYPVQMKKGRTGLRIEALVYDRQREAVARALFAHSTTLGLRFWPVERQVLLRETKTIEWRGFPIRIKTSAATEGHVTCKPEYDDIEKAARALGLPPLRVRQEIERLLDPRG
ncbi:MAG: nickel pincer cofactor biosynthesis protein LarC [Gemmatimonadales bacterium]